MFVVRCGCGVVPCRGSRTTTHTGLIYLVHQQRGQLRAPPIATSLPPPSFLPLCVACSSPRPFPFSVLPSRGPPPPAGPRPPIPLPPCPQAGCWGVARGGPGRPASAPCEVNTPAPLTPPSAPLHASLWAGWGSATQRRCMLHSLHLNSAVHAMQGKDPHLRASMQPNGLHVAIRIQHAGCLRRI